MWSPTLTGLAVAALAAMLGLFYTLGYMLGMFGDANRAFLALFFFRYCRLIVAMVANYFFYKPAPEKTTPKYSPEDVSIILPTVDPQNKGFAECVSSCFYNRPKTIYVVTVGQHNVEFIQEYISGSVNPNFYPEVRVEVRSITGQASKRAQIASVIPEIMTPITVLVDDHVFLPKTFLRSTLAAFEDEQVTLVGTSKSVRLNPIAEQHPESFLPVDFFFNMLGALYLDRHNFDATASITIDGGVFSISGRASAIRTDFVQNRAFIDAYLNEQIWGRVLNADDDNFLTRAVYKAGKKVFFQATGRAKIETSLGEYPRFNSQTLRWARTTYRSNARLLATEPNIWLKQPFSCYSVYFSGMVNYALLTDGLLVYLLTCTSAYQGNRWVLLLLLWWIFTSKWVKIWEFFYKYPKELLMVIGHFVYVYYHSFLKLLAMITWWDVEWSGRKLATVNELPDGDAHPDTPLSP